MIYTKKYFNLIIFITGMMGSGKSSIAQKLSEDLSIVYYDLDKEIEKKAGMKINKIVNYRGITYFRELEADALKFLIDSHNDIAPIIVATGGGTSFYHADYLFEKGVVVYLKTKIRILVERLYQNSNDRPLLLGLKSKSDLLKKLTALYKEREKSYNKCHLEVQVKEENLNEVAAKIGKIIKRLGLIII